MRTTISQLIVQYGPGIKMGNIGLISDLARNKDKVMIALFKNDGKTSIIYEVDSICRNGEMIQININENEEGFN